MSTLDLRLAGLSPAKRRLLLKRLDERREESTGEEVRPRIERRPPGGAPPLSFAQERLWFLDQMVSGNPFYNIPTALRLWGPLEIGPLAAALSEIIRRHETLRTTFEGLEGRAAQRIEEPRPVSLQVVDLGGLPEGRREVAVERLARREALRPFDLSRGPLARFRLMRLAPRGQAPQDHVLLATLHHIIADGWSLGVLVRELGALYRAFAEGRPSPLPELSVQYADFALWQRRTLGEGTLAEQLEYWKGRLADLPVVELRPDHPRSAHASYRGGTVARSIPRGVAAELEAFRSREGYTLFMVMLGAFQVLLARYTGQDDVIVGTPIANRNLREIEGLIGFFVNSLVLRTDLTGEPGFEEVIRRVRETALGAYDHQDLPFEKVVEELQPRRELGRNPLFDVVFAVQNAPRRTPDMGPLRIEPLGGAGATSRFDLQLDVWGEGETLLAVFQYRSDLYEAATVQRLADHLTALLEAALGSPERPIWELPLLSDRELHQVTAEWVGGAAEVLPAVSGPTLLPDGFAAQVAAVPDAVALVAGDERWSYAALGARVARLAGRLRELGVGPEVRVGLFLERGVDQVVAILGTLVAGGTYVPVDPGDPEDRVAYVLGDAGVAVVVTDRLVRDRLPAGDYRTIEAGAPVEEEATGEHGLPRFGGDAETGAYVIYTSGTTGRPKGVVVPHRTVAALFQATAAELGLGPEDVWTLFHSYAFDFSVWELWGALLHGGTLVIVPRWTARSAEAFRELIGRERVTVLNQTPSAFRQLMAADRRAADVANAADLALRWVIFGGEALDLETLRPWYERHGDRRPTLVNMYGITETTVHVTRLDLDRDGLDAASRIGRPLPHLRGVLLDARGRATPPGAVGELFVGGAGVARGYLGRPALTAERFVPDPYAPVAGARRYRTGDLARWRPDRAELEFVGRADHQVKIRGFRIETGEIESALVSHPAVAESVVLARDDGEERRLVAYVVQSRQAVRGDADAFDAGQREQVERWASVFDDTYDPSVGRHRDPEAGRPGFDIVGWNSSYTGEPIPAAEMREWVEDTVAWIAAAAPRRVLEIGCGTGLLLSRLAPGTDRYLATDLSEQALVAAGRLVETAPGTGHAELERRAADDFTGVEPGSFDAVILNSVAQYFPSAEYLDRVLEGALQALRPGGTLFVGDVRSLPLLDAFHASVELHRAPDGEEIAELRRRLERRRLEENELVLAPSYFVGLAERTGRVGRVRITPKRGRSWNEMSRFRYQVALRVGGDETEPIRPEWLDWRSEGLALEVIRRRLERERPAALGVAGVPNARVTQALRAVDLLAGGRAGRDAGELRRRLEEAAQSEDPGVDPDALWSMGEELGYRVELSWARQAGDGTLDAVFVAGDGDADRPVELPRPSSSSSVSGLPANDPLLGAFARRMVPELRSHLQGRLPAYMVPSAFVPLRQLPLNRNGKVDRGALPAPESARPGLGGRFVPPRDETEERVARLWCELLGLDRVGVEDDFFALGGHSLLGTQVVSGLRSAFGVELPLRALFEEPTVAGLARRIEEALPAAGPPPLTPSPSAEPAPLSFAQERLWFLHRLQPSGSFYNELVRVPIEEVHAASLATALRALIRRQEVLRTRFPVVDGVPVQEVAPVPDTHRVLTVADLSALPAGERGRQEVRLAEALVSHEFDLAAGSPIRAALVRSGPRRHRLVLALHHIVIDGWSQQILRRELSELYRAARHGGAAALPDLPIRYADFARWQREWLRGQILDEQLGYWRDRLAGLEPLDLPTDRPRPRVPGDRGRSVPVVLDAALAARVRELGRTAQATPFMTLLALFSVLLGRFADSADVAVGSPVANRNRPEVEGLIGFFVNMLVHRVRLDAARPVRGLLERVRSETVASFDHQDLPFEKLVEELRPDRDPGRNPLFQVCFQLLAGGAGSPGGSAPSAGAGARAAAVEAVGHAGRLQAKFDLYLALVDRGDRIAGYLEYDSDLFDETTVRRLGRTFEGLVRSAVAAPESPLDELDALVPSERHQVLREWSGEAGAAPGGRWGERSIAERFAAVAAERPDAVALAAEDRYVTYGELARRAGDLARRLAAGGVSVETRVALAVERSPELVTALLGVLGAGGAYVPLDPEDPPKRLRFLLADADARVVLADAAGESRLADVAGDRPVVRVSETPGFPGQEGSEAREMAASPGLSSGPWPGPSPGPFSGSTRLAYVLYTSGSTGRPKGVAVPERAVLRLVNDPDWVRLGPDETVLGFAPASFDASTFEIWGPLLHGGRLELAPPRPLGPEEVGALIERRRITTAWLTSALFQQVVDGALERLQGVRQLLAGGDVLSMPHVRRVVEELPRARLVDGYGPTENTTFTSCHRVGAVDGRRRSIPIGRPIRGTRAYVLDPSLRPVAPGMPGELYAAGDGLARGYAGRPAWTAERFLPDSLGPVPGARMYATGDRVRFLAEGVLEFLGRRDHQVKVRGFRIEPGEVEARLLELPEVREAVVVARDREGADQLVAYVVPAPGAAPAAADLRGILRDRLPAFMVPAAVEILDALPLTSSGKLDRRALPEPAWERGEPAATAPRGPVEELVAAAWAEVLDLDRVGVHEDFFDLGGHSLLASRVTSRIRRDLGVEVPLASLFERPTVAGLARWVEAELQGAGVRELPPIEPAPGDADLLLSFAQERLWFFDRLQPGNAFYNMPMAVRMEGYLDPAALADALTTVVRRHEALRTAFFDVDGRPRQWIVPPGRIDPGMVDLSSLPRGAREGEAGRLSALAAALPFDLERPPLLRACFVRLEPRFHLLLLTVHHIASDGWSMSRLISEVETLYRGAVEGTPVDLPDLPVQYRDYAVWQRRWLEGEGIGELLERWTGRLAGHPMRLNLPTDRPRPPIQTLTGGRETALFDPELTAAVDSVARATSATRFMVLLAAFQVLLARWSGQPDPLVATTVANRTRPEVEPLIGFFVNTLVLRGDVTDGSSFRDHVARARTECLEAYADQDLPYERLVEALQPERELTRNPVFQVMFSLQNAPTRVPDLPGLRLSVGGSGRNVSLFDLNVDVVEMPVGLAGSFEYNRDIFDGVTVRRMARQFLSLLRSAVDDPERRVGELALLAPAERHQVVREWNDTRNPEAETPGTFLELFAARVAAAPDAPAVIGPDGAVGYAELDRRSDRVARRLVNAGVGAETLVAVCLDHRPEVGEALLGVLKAGAAWLPLDPDYPDERLAIMVEDASPVAAVSVGALVERLPEAARRGPVLLLDDPEDDGEEGEREGDGEPVRVLPDPDSLAYCIYTSGSTGRPKGVMISHRSLAVFTVAAARELDLGPRDRFLQFASLGFDVAVEELFTTWASGGAAILTRDDRLHSVAGLLPLLEEEGVTALELPTAFWQQWAGELRDRGSALPESLRFVVVGGEDMAVERLADWERLRTPLYHVYGLTETTVSSTLGQPPPGRESTAARTGALPVGRPMAGSEIFVLDPGLEPSPPGVFGEVFVGGELVGRGYLGRGGLTAERFVPHPFPRRPGERLYRTGDRGRVLPDGSLELAGRIDRQVKVRGHRIEPAEVEAVLATHPSVGHAVVDARGEGAGRRLVAWIVADGEGAPDDGLHRDVRTWLRGRLPEPMVPASVVVLDALPLTVHGKVDRPALPDPDGSRPSGDDGYVAPRSPVEEQLAAIFAEVLELERVGVEDDFFDLGGHSLVATRVVSRIRRHFEVDVPLRRLFEAPTVEALAVAVVEAQMAAADDDAMAAAIDELEGLSDDEVRELLGE